MSESDFAEFIRILRQHRVRFLVIGGYAMAHHGLVRATNDVDLLVATDSANVARIRAATLEFVGAEPNESALRPPRGMFRIGPPAAHVDVTTKIDGIADFDRAWERRSKVSGAAFLGDRGRRGGLHRSRVRSNSSDDRPAWALDSA